VPPKTRYPLDALLQRRQDLEDGKTRALATRMRETGDAAQSRRRAEEVERSHQQEVEATVRHECDRTDGGAGQVQDLLTMQAWEIAQQARAAVLREETERAAREAQAAAERETLARGELASAKAEAEVVEQDRQRFVEAMKRQEQARADEDAEESHAARAFLEKRRHRP